MRAGKRMTVAQSNEHLRVGNSSAWKANVAGTLDPTRTHLNFEIGRGGVIKEVDQKTSIPKRIKAIFAEKGIQDPNIGLTDEDLEKKGVGIRTHANIILQGSTETMRQLSFGDQEVNYERGADNSDVTRSAEIEKWALEMYSFIADKYGEENIAAFVVHLDESNPHVHCTLLPIMNSNRLSYKEMFVGKDKYEYSERTKHLHDELAVINEKWGLKRGDSIAVTGAQHKSYLQWLKEQIIQKEKTVKEQDETISQQATTISEQKQQLYNINRELKQAEKRIKGLTTMIRNLEEQKERTEIDISALEEMSKNGEITYEELEKKRSELESRILDIETKIGDKSAKLSEAQKKLEEIAIKKHQLQNSYDDLQRKINQDLPTLLDKTERDINAVMWEEAAREMKKDYSSLQDFSEKLPPSLKMELDSLLEGSVFEDVAKRGEEIAGVAAALFLGYIDQATTFARGNGGGGSGPGSGWGRKKDEDDEAYSRRCCIMGRMMMRPAGRRIKRS